VFVRLISHQPAVLFSQNKPATSNQPTVFFSHNKPAPAISHQPNEQAADVTVLLLMKNRRKFEKPFSSREIRSSRQLMHREMTKSSLGRNQQFLPDGVHETVLSSVPR
jgi:hypothetical protein